jgi:MazG family protein
MPTRPDRRPATERRRRRGALRRGAGAAVDRLIRIMAQLRAPIGGCPWDVKQTHESLRPYLLEETYEAVDAIDRGDLDALAGELGDVLLQCVFHAQIAADAGRFDMADVASAISDKLVRRHPHVFSAKGRPLSADARAKIGVDTPGAVKEQWAAIKAREQAAAGIAPRVLAGLPRALPALVRAQKIGARAASVGFDWPSPDAVVAKVHEELDELARARQEGLDRVRDELGDVLFSLVNLARHLGIDAEQALSAANDKFTARFDVVESAFQQRGRDVHGASPADLDRAWREAKTTVARQTTRRGPSTTRRGRRGR